MRQMLGAELFPSTLKVLPYGRHGDRDLLCDLARSIADGQQEQNGILNRSGFVGGHLV
jgi:hypothetical protein